MARRLSIPSALHRTHTNAGLLFSHFDGVRLFPEVVPGLPIGPYPDDWAAVHHIVDEGWMYSLRFDHGVTSAGFVLSARGQRQLPVRAAPDELWRYLLERYPTVRALFGGARALMPIGFRKRIQHRLTRAAGAGWALLPHAYGFVDPLFSTGIAWSLKAIERLALCFERGSPGDADLNRYAALLSAEADQIDLLVAGAYEAMAHFEVFAAQAMIYFAAVSFAEARQRLAHQDSETAAWTGFLGVGDPQLGPLPRASFRRLGRTRTREDRRLFVQWVRRAIAPRNVCGFANPDYRNLYPVDQGELVRRHGVLGMSRDAIVSALPALRA